MDNVDLISIFQLLTGATVIGISLFMYFRSVKPVIKKQRMRWIFTISLMLSGVYLLLVMLSIKQILSVEALSGGFALVCSFLIAVMVTGTRTVTNLLHEEISEHNISKDIINDLSLSDELTMLYNRKGFISIVDKNLTRLKRIKKKAVLFYLELNNLQEINEKSGYEEGDKVLANIGTLMTAAFREADVIARIGDDEFIAFLVDADIDNLESVKNKFKDKLHTYNEKRSAHFKLSVSFAISSFDPEINDSALEMISKVSSSVKQKKKQEQSTGFALAENGNNNFTLIVSNMSNNNSPIDIKIYIDEELVIDDTFTTGMQNAWKPFHFKLDRGKHSIKAKSMKGKTTLHQEFKIKRDHWASIEYHKDDETDTVVPSASGKLSFKLHDVPIKHKFVRPVEKFV